MKTIEEIIEIAHNHLIKNPFPHIDYEWVLKKDYKELKNEYYFDYSFQHKKNIPENEWEMFAGAPGFCVNSESGTIRDVSWDEYQRIIKR